MNIEFNETYQNYIQEQLDTGAHSSSSELLGEALRAAFFEGEYSGEPEPWDINQIIAEAKQEINA